MGVFTDIDARIRVLADANEIAQVLDDRLDSINEDSANNYPLLLYRVVRESSDKYSRDIDNPVIEIEFFLSDLWYEGNTNTIAQMRDNLCAKLDKVIKGIPIRTVSNNLRVLDSSNAEYAWEQHNDNLFIIKRTASIQASRLNCL